MAPLFAGVLQLAIIAVASASLKPDCASGECKSTSIGNTLVQVGQAKAQKVILDDDDDDEEDIEVVKGKSIGSSLVQLGQTKTQNVALEEDDEDSMDRPK